MYVLGLLIAVLGLSLNAQANVEVLKTMDGKSAICSSDSDSSDTFESTKIIMVRMGEYKNKDNQTEASLEASLVKCAKGGGWIADMNPSVESYTAPNGEKVVVQYSDYELFIVDGKGDVVLHTQLAHLNKAKSKIVPTQVNLTRTKEAVQQYEVFIRAIKEVSSESGYFSREYISFGVFNLLLKN